MRKTILFILANFLIFTGYADTKQDKGQDIYKQYCSVCHMSGVAGAPKAHDQKAWDARYQAAYNKAKQANPNAKPEDLNKMANEQLANSVINGLSSMPAGGMCPNTTCKDKSDYISAINFMRSEEKK